MADETQGGAAPQAANPPSMNLVGQYIRDLSFENPGAPASIMAGGASPAFNVSISVGVKKQTDDVYAVELTLNAKANREETVLFNVELVYGGVFRLRNIPVHLLQAVLYVDCPTLLFPFAAPRGFAGLRVSVTFAPVAAVFAEYTGSTDGIGYLMLQSIPRLQTDFVFAQVLVLTVMSSLLLAAVTVLERLICSWNTAPSGKACCR